MKQKLWRLVAAVALLFGLTPVQAWGALPARVVWEYTVPGKSMIGSLSLTEQGTFLATRNGFLEPAVIELNDQGEIIWEYGPIQANSAFRLGNGNVLIADSGAPGYPLEPRVLEVDKNGQIMWTYNLPSRALSPRLARETAKNKVLIVLTDRVIEVSRSGEVLWQYGGLYYPVWAERLPSGNTLIVDRGFYGGKVLEVDNQGRIQWEYGDYGEPGKAGFLSRPVWAARLADGSTLISDRGAARLLKVQGQEVELVDEWAEVLKALPVSDRWVALPDLTSEQIYLSLTLTSGRSVIWQLERGIKTFIQGEPYQFAVSPVVIDGVLYGGAREFMELVGAQINWKQETKELEILQEGVQGVLTVDAGEGRVGGEAVSLAPPRIYGGNTVLPLEFIREYFGLDYRWDEGKRELYIRP